MNPGNRHSARELALQILFQLEYFSENEYRSAFGATVSQLRPEKHTLEYAEVLVFGVLEKLNEIDALLQGHTRHWKISRMDKVDRNTLRLGAYELLYMASEIPPKVAISEAVELAKTFGNTESPGFINGILDAVAKTKLKMD